MSAFTNVDWKWALAFLLDCAVKGALVVLLAAAISWVLRRGSAAARHSVWSAAVAAQLLIPVCGLLLPTWRVALVSEPAWVASSGSVGGGGGGGGGGSSAVFPISETVNPTTTALPAGSTPPIAVSPLVIVAAIWILGALMIIGRLVVGTAIVSRMAARGERVVDEKWLGTMHRLAVSLGISRPLTLLRGDAVGVPVTWGIVYPVVFLPREADTWPEERRRYVLVHEMAHVKRLDAFTQLVAQIAVAVFWFNPLVWLAASRMRRERENACDDYVLTHGTKPSEYASDLLELVRSIGTSDRKATAPAFAALAMARRSEFEGRMLSILDPQARRTSMTAGRIAASSAAALLLVAPLAAFSPFDASARTLVARPSATPGPAERTGVQPASMAKPANATNAGAATVLSTFSRIAGSPCDNLTNGTTNSSHINEDDDSPASRRVQLLRRSPGYCFEAALDGRMTFARDDRDIIGMSPEARARFREHTATADREIIVRPANGGVTREYFEGGKPATFDDAARQWFGTMVLTAIRESGIDAGDRVTRISRSSGGRGVLSEIGTITSSGAKRNYYLAYLQSSVAISEDDLARTLRQAKLDLASSSGDMRNVLQVAMRRDMRSAQARGAFADAAASMTSDGDKSAVLTQMAMTADRDLLVDIMRVAKTIDSDGDKSRLLITTAARYLLNRDAELRDSYFALVEQVGSDGDRARVLISASAYGSADEAVTLACIRATHPMESDGDKASVLISMAGRRLIASPRIKDAFLTATNRIDSDSDRARVLSAMIGG